MYFQMGTIIICPGKDVKMHLFAGQDNLFAGQDNQKPIPFIAAYFCSPRNRCLYSFISITV